jgi:hypothetical protein
MNLGCITLVLLSAVGMFLLGRLYFREAGGWLAASAYLYAPYFADNLYVRTAWAEFAAFPFFAFALYGFGAFAKTRERRFLVIGAAAYAGILASHNAAALVFTPLLLGFIALTAWLEGSWAIARSQAIAFVVGLMLAAFIWVPGVTMNQFVHLETLTEGATRYSNHFVYLHQLIDSPWGYGFSVPGDQDGMSFSLGWSHLLIAAIAMWMARRNPWVWFFAGAVAILALMMSTWSEPIWDHVRLLQYLAFPWRLLGPAAVALAALIAAFPQWRKAGFITAMALLIVPNLAHFQPRVFRDIDEQFWSPQQIAERGIEVTTFGEYRPKQMNTVPGFDPRPAEVVSGYADVRQASKSPESWTGSVHAQSPATVEMSLAYFPAWSVAIDDKVVEPRAADRTGLLRFDVPQGDHRVAIRWTRTRAMWIADALSLLALCLLAAAAIPEKRGERVKETPVHASVQRV